MNVTIRLAATFFVCVGAVSAFSVAIADEPTLSETLAWIESTYNPHDDKGGAWGHGREEWANDGKPFRLRTETIKTDGCKLTLTLKDDPRVAIHAAMTSVITTDLKDVDPKSIEFTTFDSQHGGLGCERFPNLNLNCDMASIVFETYNQKPSMSEQFDATFPSSKVKKNGGPTRHQTFVASIALDDVNYANRFLKAFQHAVALCGGKPSPF